MSLQDLTFKIPMLLALTRPSRPADLLSLALRFRLLSAEEPFILGKLSKLSKKITFPFPPSDCYNHNHIKLSHHLLYLGGWKPYWPGLESTEVFSKRIQWGMLQLLQQQRRDSPPAKYSRQQTGVVRTFSRGSSTNPRRTANSGKPFCMASSQLLLKATKWHW